MDWFKFFVLKWQCHEIFWPFFRIGNLLFGFSDWITRFLWEKERNSDLLVSNERISIPLYFKEPRQRITHGRSFVKSHGSEALMPLKKSNREKSYGGDSHLDIKRRKQWKTAQKQGENYEFFRANLYHKGITHVALFFLKTTRAICSYSLQSDESNFSQLVTQPL